MSTEPSTTLQRRRELARLSKPQLIDRIIDLEVGVESAVSRIERVAEKLEVGS